MATPSMEGLVLDEKLSALETADTDEQEKSISEKGDSGDHPHVSDSNLSGVVSLKETKSSITDDLSRKSHTTILIDSSTLPRSPQKSKESISIKGEVDLPVVKSKKSEKSLYSVKGNALERGKEIEKILQTPSVKSRTSSSSRVSIVSEQKAEEGNETIAPPASDGELLQNQSTDNISVQNYDITTDQFSVAEVPAADEPLPLEKKATKPESISPVSEKEEIVKDENEKEKIVENQTSRIQPAQIVEELPDSEPPAIKETAKKAEQFIRDGDAKVEIEDKKEEKQAEVKTKEETVEDKSEEEEAEEEAEEKTVKDKKEEGAKEEAKEETVEDKKEEEEKEEKEEIEDKTEEKEAEEEAKKEIEDSKEEKEEEEEAKEETVENKKEEENEESDSDDYFPETDVCKETMKQIRSAIRSALSKMDLSKYV